MLKTQSKRNAGNKIYSVVGWFCYIACTIISAILNIYLLSKLDQSWAWFLLTMSLSLEFGKAYILIKANTYRSLVEYLKNCKFKSGKVARKESVFYSLYVLFAVLSITASLCFSLTITDKTEQGFTLQKQEISQNIETVEKSQNKYEEALEKFTMLQDNREVSEKAAKENLRNKKEAYEIAGEKLDIKAKELCLSANDDPFNWTKYRKGNPDYDKYRSSIGYDKIVRDYNYAKEDYNDILSGKALVRAEDTYNAAKQEFEEKVKLYGSLESLKLGMSTIEKQELEMAGSSKCFILLANTFGIPDKVKTIKFIILLYVSLLVELCIWLSSPDLRLDGGLLYSYRNDLGLSTKKDVDKLLKEIKDTNIRFSVKEEEVKIIEKVPVKTLKEIDNLKEQIELLNREKEETDAFSNDLKNKYEEQINSLNNMISSLEDDKSILEQQINEKTEFADKLENEYLNFSQEADDRYKNSIDQQNRTINELVNENKELDEKVKLLENEKEEIINQLKENPSSVSLEEEYLDQISKLVNKSNSFENSLNEEKKKNDLLKSDLDTLKKENSSLNDKLIEASAKDDDKYSEEEVKEAIKKTAEKSKKEIKSLKEQVVSWEDAYNKMAEENSNLKLANASLENNNKELIIKNDMLSEPKEEPIIKEEPKKKSLSEIKIGTLEDEIEKLLK